MPRYDEDQWGSGCISMVNYIPSVCDVGREGDASSGREFNMVWYSKLPSTTSYS